MFSVQSANTMCQSMWDAIQQTVSGCATLLERVDGLTFKVGAAVSLAVEAVHNQDRPMAALASVQVGRAVTGMIGIASAATTVFGWAAGEEVFLPAAEGSLWAYMGCSTLLEGASALLSHMLRNCKEKRSQSEREMKLIWNDEFEARAKLLFEEESDRVQQSMNRLLKFQMRTSCGFVGFYEGSGVIIALAKGVIDQRIVLGVVAAANAGLKGLRYRAVSRRLDNIEARCYNLPAEAEEFRSREIDLRSLGGLSFHSSSPEDGSSPPPPSPVAGGGGAAVFTPVSLMRSPSMSSLPVAEEARRNSSPDTIEEGDEKKATGARAHQMSLVMVQACYVFLDGNGRPPTADPDLIPPELSRTTRALSQLVGP